MSGATCSNCGSVALFRDFSFGIRMTRLRDRVEAATWLADRGLGRPAAAMSPDQVDSERVSLELVRTICAAADDPKPPRVYEA